LLLDLDATGSPFLFSEAGFADRGWLSLFAKAAPDGRKKKTSVVSAKIMALIGRRLSQAEPIRILGAVPKPQDFHASSRFIDAIKDQVGP
jgi:hypothetical protein